MAIKIFVVFILVFAVFAGCSAAYFSPNQLINFVWIRDLIDAMLPIIAAGAIIKYLLS